VENGEKTLTLEGSRAGSRGDRSLDCARDTELVEVRSPGCYSKIILVNVTAEPVSGVKAWL
jgi:hypothetical protein